MSAICKPLALSSFGTENTGPMPISSGSQPATVKPRKNAFGLRPSASALSRLISRVMEAPSESCEALPAVTEPSSAKTGFSEFRPSRVVSGRLQSSWSTTASSTRFSPVALSSTSYFTAIGTISSANRPSAWARAVRCWLCRA
ncbi:hypothetical protein D3C76_1040550 [compost metagenome]